MLSIHVHRVIGGGVPSLPHRSAVVGAKRSSDLLRTVRFSIRNLRSSTRVSDSYKPSYDPRKPEVTPSWPHSRQAELEDLLSKVHPDATVRKANAKDFAFRVRPDVRAASSAPDSSTSSVMGLLKPPAIMRGTDPQDLKAKEKRNELRAALIASLADSSATSSPAHVNSIHTKLRDLDLEDIRAGYEPTYFTRADLDHLINAPLPHAPPRSSLFSPTQTPLESSQVEEEVDWSQVKVENESSISSSPAARTFANTSPNARSFNIANTPIRRKLLQDILANAQEMELLEKQGLVVGPSTAALAVSSTTTLHKMNRLTIHRIFGLIMQTALVLPWAVGRKISETKKGDFWAFEQVARTKHATDALDKQIEKVRQQIADSEAYKAKLMADIGKGSILFHTVRTFGLRAFVTLLKIFSIYPLQLIYVLTREVLTFAFYCIMGPVKLAEQLYSKFILPSYGKSGLRGPIAVAWGALAPITWKRYAAGENIGTLWDRNTEHSEQILQYQRSSFHKMGYGIERAIFGLFHNNRLIGLAALLIIGILITGTTFEADPSSFANELASNTAEAQL